MYVSCVGGKQTRAQKEQRILNGQMMARERCRLKREACKELFEDRAIGAKVWNYVLNIAGWREEDIQRATAHFSGLHVDAEKLKKSGRIAIFVPKARITLDFIAQAFGITFHFVGFRAEDGSENERAKLRIGNEPLPKGSIIFLDRIVRECLCGKSPKNQKKNIEERGETLNSLIPFILKNAVFHNLEEAVLGDSIMTRCGEYAGVSVAVSWLMPDPNPCINIYQEKENALLTRNSVSMCGVIVVP